jgi:hypothetical protein
VVKTKWHHLKYEFDIMYGEKEFQKQEKYRLAVEFEIIESRFLV